MEFDKSDDLKVNVKPAPDAASAQPVSASDCCSEYPRVLVSELLPGL